MYYSYSDEELRAYCRNSIESLEMWARRLIHEKMIEKYGDQYLDYQNPDGSYVINSEMRKHIHNLLQNEPQRMLRPVDALFLDHLAYFLCKPEWYKALYKEALDLMYPEGKDEVRTFLKRLIPIRNALSHSNPISVRQAEQAICYSNDFIDSLKKYYRKRGMEKVWNVPNIIRAVDSFGNVFENPDDVLSFKIPQSLHCGDTYSVSIEIDSSFPPRDYDIVWRNGITDVESFSNVTKFVIKFTEKDIEELHGIRCDVISHKNWHRHGYYDSKLLLLIEVLPPIDE